MRHFTLTTTIASALCIVGIFSANPAMADKPAWAGKGGKNERSEHGGGQRDNDGDSRRDKEGPSSGKRDHFSSQHRVYVHDYYDKQTRNGRCPPGLAKKNNGCMPPGQAKKWERGQPLPRDVVFYEVPRPLVVQIGIPPSGYRYVRVATDILMIAIGTRMVVDAIEDLGR